MTCSQKVLIAVGGWNMGPGPFSDMAMNDAARAKFVTTSPHLDVGGGGTF